MCIIIYKPKGKTVPLEFLANSWSRNRDGGGFMYARDGHIRITKTLESFAAWNELYQKIHPVNHNVVIHFRIGTSGGRNLENCHPFPIGNTLAFCHNGIMPFEVDKTSPFSDTVIFGRNVLERLPPGWHKNRATLYLIRSFIGSGKIVILDKQGNVTIINEDAGHWHDGIWYSNHSYESFKPPIVREPEEDEEDIEDEGDLPLFGMPLNQNYTNFKRSPWWKDKPKQKE